MTDGKPNLPDDLLLLSCKSTDERLSSFKDRGGIGEDKSLLSLPDDSKDQVTADNTIPLSPQWLYAKPVDAKSSTTGASGETRASNSLSHGNSSDSNLKDNWRLDGSQDKKDRRRIAPDVESSRRWREEERDTGLLGRKDRRKEDHRADSVSARDISETRTLPSSDRWHDGNNRNSAHESRRDSKWSSRWGPEEKEKDSRNDKRADVEKDEAHSDKQNFGTASRPTSERENDSRDKWRPSSERENDSRDKWRPRHRMEVHSGGPAAYRSAPGFGSERGRVESPNVPFAAGRGRSNNSGNLQIGRHLTASIGSIPVDKNHAFCYPRGKLLDIYRKHKTLPSFDTIPDGMELVSPLTQEIAIKPLAFVAPDAEQEAVLGDIWLGKITSSGGLNNSFREKNESSNNNTAGIGEENVSFSVKTEEIADSFGKITGNASGQGMGAEMFNASMAEEKDMHKDDKQKCVTTSGRALIDGFVPAVFKRDESSSVGESGLIDNVVDLKAFERQPVADVAFQNNLKLEDIESATSFEIGSQLPDDSSSLFDFSSAQQNSRSHQFSYLSDGQVGRRTPERKKSVPWTEEEHRIFLLGLEKLGKGDWRGISRNFVTTRTPTQVASHAQKYFLRQNSLTKRKRRPSLFDVGNGSSSIQQVAASIPEVIIEGDNIFGGLPLMSTVASPICTSFSELGLGHRSVLLPCSSPEQVGSKTSSSPSPSKA